MIARAARGASIVGAMVVAAACASPSPAPRPSAPKPPLVVVASEETSATPVDDDPDRDAIKGDADKCPTEPETYNGIDDEDGCPDKCVLPIPPVEVQFPEAIHFAQGSAKFVDDDRAVVHAIAEALVGHPELSLLEVEGFADDDLPEKQAISLSTKRAESVRAALVAQGVDAARLRVKGYGPYCRVDASKAGAARKKNRRVEVRVAATTSSAVVASALGCAEATAHGVAPDPIP